MELFTPVSTSGGNAIPTLTAEEIEIVAGGDGYVPPPPPPPTTQPDRGLRADRVYRK